MPEAQDNEAPRSSIDLIDRASSGRAPEIERMPRPTLRLMLPMSDGVRLDTWIWLPTDNDGPFPAILTRTPYAERVLGWARTGVMDLRAQGYAVVFQLIRGTGDSEGQFTFTNPLERSDGYTTIEWIAGQPWCTGAIGMDGSSYAGMTQLYAAVSQPPHLRCITPTVVSAHPFLHAPRWGGAFSRQHTIGWAKLISVETLGEMPPGFWGGASLLGAPATMRTLLHRPAVEAADSLLAGDRLQHYRDALLHDSMDAFNRARTLMPEDYARIAMPSLVVTGLFDGSPGSLWLWENLEKHAPPEVERRLLIGPWDHGQAYVGGASRYGPFRFGSGALLDIRRTRLEFFDRHLKGIDTARELPARTVVYVNRQDRWRLADELTAATRREQFFLDSDGCANLRGRGGLRATPVAGEQPADSYVSDPELPILPVLANIDPEKTLDLREIERCEDVLTYNGEPLDAPLTVFGSPTVDLHLACDAPDCDVVCWLAEVIDDSATTLIARGLLRLRYRHGFGEAVFLELDRPTRVEIALDFAAHTVPAGARLRLLVGSSLFPLIDPNPNTAEPVGTARTTRRALVQILHDSEHRSCVEVPVLDVERERMLESIG